MTERRQGQYFESETVLRIKYLLAETDLSMPEIARRMGCSKGAIASINRKFCIRMYCNTRSTWTDGRMVPIDQSQ